MPEAAGGTDEIGERDIAGDIEQR